MKFLKTLDRIDDFIHQENWPDAESLTWRAIRQFGKSDSLQIRLVKILLVHNRNQKAWKILNSLDTSSTDLQVIRCQLAYRLKREKEAHELLSHIKNNLPLCEREEIEDLARDLYYGTHYEESKALLKWLVETGDYETPYLYQLSIALALCAWILDDCETEGYARLALEIKPSDPLALSLIGNHLIDQGDKDQGIQVLEKVGFHQLLHLQCEEGAKRLFRWHIKNHTDAEYLRRLSSTMNVWEKQREWEKSQMNWVDQACHNLLVSSFLIDCPRTERVIGFCYDSKISDRPLVNVSLQSRERECALEEATFYCIPCYSESDVVSRWFDNVGEKVVAEPSIFFWEIVQSIC